MIKKIKRRTSTAEAGGFSEGLPPILQRIFQARGLDSEAQLQYDLKHLIPFNQLLGIDKAVARLVQALAREEKILILGDFDADGATSSALAVSALRAFGAKEVTFLVPNRFAYGYGLTPEIVEVAQRWQPNLIITVDNGIASFDGVEAAKAHGIEVVITDHHLPAAALPAATAIVNPNQPDDPFPSKNLAGVGVIFYVMLALRRQLVDNGWFEKQNCAPVNMGQFLDLVALGTVADVVPLDYNNRILVEQGLRRIRAGQCRPGIKALLTCAKRELGYLTASDLGFAVAPRLNAAGRLDDMSLGIECLLSTSQGEADRLARELDELNQTRKTIEDDMKREAFKSLDKLKLASGEALPLGLCLYDKTWHQGVIGILAGRVKDKLNRPVIAFAKVNETELKGSARSIRGLHIRDLLDAIATSHPDLITKFGGHAMAAGLSLPLAKFEAFSKVFNETLNNFITADDLDNEIVTDGALSPEEFDLKLAREIRYAGPWGQHFPEPLFDGEFKLLDQRLVGEKHLKMTLGLQDSLQTFDAIAFNVDLDRWPNHRCETIQAAFRLDVNRYRGREQLQLMLETLDET